MNGKVKRLPLKIAIVSLLVLAVGLAWFMARSLPADPVYASRSPHARGSREWTEADDAVRHIGTNAIPLLLYCLGQNDSSIKLKLAVLARKQHLVKIRFVPAPTRNREASMAFIALGSTASNAVPGLIKLYDENRSEESRCAVEDVFSWIGPGAERAIPLLISAANDPDPKTRANALWALGEIHTQPQLCVPILIRALTDVDGSAQTSAIHALGKFGSDAQAAIPSLTALSKKPQDSAGRIMFDQIQIYNEVRRALKKIDPQGEGNVLALDPLRTDTTK